MKKVDISINSVRRLAIVDESEIKIENCVEFGCKNVLCGGIECEDCIFDKITLNKTEFLNLIVEK